MPILMKNYFIFALAIVPNDKLSVIEMKKEIEYHCSNFDCGYYESDSVFCDIKQKKIKKLN